MRRLRKRTVVSVLLAGFGIAFLVMFAMTSSIPVLVIAFVLVFASGMARKKESYDDYRARYEESFGMNAESESDEKGEEKGNPT